jgi:hypothetical protein
MLLKLACTGEADKFIKRLMNAEKCKYTHTVSDKAQALLKLAKLKQKSGESLRVYATTMFWLKSPFVESGVLTCDSHNES